MKTRQGRENLFCLVFYGIFGWYRCEKAFAVKTGLQMRAFGI